MINPKGEYRPSIHRFSLGEAEVTTIQDGAHIREPINPPFSMEKSEADIKKLLTRTTFLPVALKTLIHQP